MSARHRVFLSKFSLFRFVSHLERTIALLQYPHFVFFKDKYTGADWRPWCQDLVSLNLVDGTKTAMKFKPPRTLSDSKIIEGRILLTGDVENTYLLSLDTGNLLATLAGSFSSVEVLSLGNNDVDANHLCYIRLFRTIWELRSGSLLLLLL